MSCCFSCTAKLCSQSSCCLSVVLTLSAAILPVHPLFLSVSLGECACVYSGGGLLNNAVGISTLLVLRLSRFIFKALPVSRGGFVFTVYHSEVNTFLSVHCLCVHYAQFQPTCAACNILYINILNGSQTSYCIPKSF